VGVTAYGVLSRGLLSGSRLTGPSDFRAHMPRFTGENYELNQKVHATLREIAADKSATPSQIAISERDLTDLRARLNQPLFPNPRDRARRHAGLRTGTLEGSYGRFRCGSLIVLGWLPDERAARSLFKSLGRSPAESRIKCLASPKFYARLWSEESKHPHENPIGLMPQCTHRDRAGVVCGAWRTRRMRAIRDRTIPLRLVDQRTLITNRERSRAK
jgi:hypothetical protein